MMPLPCVLMITGSQIILVGTFISFFLIVYLIRKRVNFGFSLLLGSLLLAFFSLTSVPFEQIIFAFLKATIYDVKTGTFVNDTFELAVLMTLIFMLASLMQKTGAIKRLIISLRSLFSKGGTIGIIPAIYGLMPVPGGALFSAPSVKEEGEKFCINKDEHNFMNIWFRHIWFPIYPMSMSILVISGKDFSNISVASLVIANLVSFFVMIIIGLFLLKRLILKRNDSVKKNNNSRKKKDKDGLKFLLPPIVPVFFWVFYLIGLTSEKISFIFGVVFGIMLLYFLVNVSGKDFVEHIKSSLTWKYAILIIGIMVFREIFETSTANIVIFNLLETLPIPFFYLLILFPFLLGYVSGYILTGIVLTYPLLVPFFPLTSVTIVGITSIIYISTFAGYLISPLHLCNVLSSDHLKTDTISMYRIFVPAAILMLIIQITFISFFYSA